MRSFTMVKCLECNAVYDVALLKFRVTLAGWRTYERCDCCRRWAWHKGWQKGPLSQGKKPETKE